MFREELVIFDLSDHAGSEIAGWTAPLDDLKRAYYHPDGKRITVSNETSFVTAEAQTGEVWGGRIGGESSFFPTANLAHSLITVSEERDNEENDNWVVYDLDTTQPVFEAPAGWVIRGISPDEASAVITLETSDPVTCETLLVSTRDDSQPVSLEAGCLTQGELLVGRDEGRHEQPRGVGAIQHRRVRCGDRRTPGGFPKKSAYAGLSMKFTPDGAELIVGSYAGPVYVFDIESLTSGEPLEIALRLTIPADNDLVLDVIPSPDGSMVLTSAWSEPLKLWDLKTGESLGQFGGVLEGEGIARRRLPSDAPEDRRHHSAWPGSNPHTRCRRTHRGPRLVHRHGRRDD